MIWLVLIGGVLLGFVFGKLDAIRHMRQWLNSLSPEDQKYVRELMHPEDRWKSNTAHDIRLASLQRLVASEIAALETRRQAVVDREAVKGGAIAVSALRKRMDEAKLTYNGPDKDMYVREIDSLLDSLSTKYVDTIPIDEAYALMKRLDASSH